MISVFQIFRVLIGLIVFMFVISFFLRIADMYSYTQTMGNKIDAVNNFDYTAMQTYTSGNPSEFPGFKDFETVVYEPPKIKSDAGQKTLTVPVFFMPTKGEVSLERSCLDFGWFRWCCVFAFPKSAKVLFTIGENTPETRALIRKVVENLPGSLEFGFCDGTDARSSDRTQFLLYLDGSAGTTHRPCEAILPDYCKLVTINASAGFSSRIKENHIKINPSSRDVYEFNQSGFPESRRYRDWMDIAVFITGGVKALDYRNSDFSQELAASAGIMHERSLLVQQRIKDYNRQPCLECSTPLPQACGWTDQGGAAHESTAYRDFISSLQRLKSALTSGEYQSQLDDTALKYDELKNQGCES